MLYQVKTKLEFKKKRIEESGCIRWKLNWKSWKVFWESQYVPRTTKVLLQSKNIFTFTTTFYFPSSMSTILGELTTPTEVRSIYPCSNRISHQAAMKTVNHYNHSQIITHNHYDIQSLSLSSSLILNQMVSPSIISIDMASVQGADIIGIIIIFF